MPLGNVLLIGSETVDSWVGNKLISYILQSNNIAVDCIPTAQLSSHTGYPVFNGVITPLEELNIFLANTNFAKYNCIIVGYMPSAAALHAVCNTLSGVRRSHPDVIIVSQICLSHAYVYVPAEICQIISSSLLCLSHIVICNGIELEHITSGAYDGEFTVRKGASVLARRGVAALFLRNAQLKDRRNQTFTIAIDLGRKPSVGLTCETPRTAHEINGLTSFFTSIIVALGIAKNPKFNDLKDLLSRAVTTCNAITIHVFKRAKQIYLYDATASPVSLLDLNLAMLNKFSKTFSAAITVNEIELS